MGSQVEPEKKGRGEPAQNSFDAELASLITGLD